MRAKADNFKQAALAYYFKKAGMNVRLFDMIPIGFPLQLYVPQACIAVEATDLMSRGLPDRRLEELKNALCMKYGILMIRILEKWEKEYPERQCLSIKQLSEGEESFSEALKVMFRILEIPVDVDISRDRNAIKDLIHPDLPCQGQRVEVFPQRNPIQVDSHSGKTLPGLDTSLYP